MLPCLSYERHAEGGSQNAPVSSRPRDPTAFLALPSGASTSTVHPNLQLGIPPYLLKLGLAPSEAPASLKLGMTLSSLRPSLPTPSSSVF